MGTPKRSRGWVALWGATCALFGLAPLARADDVLHPGTPTLDRPTLVALGVQLPISGDDDHDATVSVRYRVQGGGAWRDAPPLFRVRPESVVGRTLQQQFAGSVFELDPGTSYEIELHAVDPDGTDQTLSLTGATRAVPGEPKTPRMREVADAAGLQSALASARAGDVIALADGTYTGQFRIDASGTAEQPIVIRGASEDGAVLDGQGCTGCNVLEVYGSFVHVERLTLAHASRALRFQGQGAEANVVRRVHIEDTILGIGSNPDQKDFYICDNQLEGRLVWPSVYADDGGAHANDDGIHVEGFGHVICHNRLIGYGDALKTEQDGARAVDFYGNEVLSAYDNGVELDGSEGNVRCFRNRFTNTYATISFQPIFGGPAYALRNVVVNVANEQMKFHALGGSPPEEPSGILVYHNTFVSPVNALANHTSDASHHFVIENNLFVSKMTMNGRSMDWTSPIDDGTFDYDGFYPDGIFDFDFGSGYEKYVSLAQARAAQPQFEPHGMLLTEPIFASGLVAADSYQTAQMPADVTLDPMSNAIDKGIVLAGINDGYTGSGPDLGALERGCALPIYGVRPEGMDESNEPVGCARAAAGTGGAGGSGGASGASGAMAGAGGGGAGGIANAGGRGNGGAGGTATPAGASDKGSAGGASGVSGSGASGGGGAAVSGGGASSKRKSSGCGCSAPGAAHTRARVWLALLLAFPALSRRRHATSYALRRVGDADDKGGN